MPLQMKSLAMRAKMYELGVVTSSSRPLGSNGNTYSEMITLALCKGFKSLGETPQWVNELVYWLKQWTPSWQDQVCHTKSKA